LGGAFKQNAAGGEFVFIPIGYDVAAPDVVPSDWFQDNKVTFSQEGKHAQAMKVESMLFG